MSGFPSAIEWRDHFTVYSEHLALIENRKKQTTIRRGRHGALDLPARDVLPLIVDSGAGGRCEAGTVRVTSATHKRYRDLDASDVWRDGFARLSDLSAALEGFYPGLTADCWLTIYGIELERAEEPATSPSVAAALDLPPREAAG